LQPNNIDYKKLFDDIIGEINQDIESNTKWDKTMSSKKKRKFDDELKFINKKIKNIPVKQDILSVNMPFKTKCLMMEKLHILYNMDKDTFPHFHLKHDLNNELEKYKKYNISPSEYLMYDEAEKKINEMNNIGNPMRNQILDSTMSFNSKIEVFNKYKHYDRLCNDSSEKPKLLKWLEYALKLPTITKPLILDNDVSKFMYNVKQTLDAELFGMTNAKEQIMFVLNNMITSKKTKGNSIIFSGPQGVGKTELANALAKAINLPFVSMSMGGARDASTLLGHSFCYTGSHPGSFVTALIKMKQLNGVLFLDEFDKIGKSERGQEVSNVLLHATDATQNHAFKDDYMGNNIPIDLSNLFFIYSVNYENQIDSTLLDRIPVIKISGYSQSEKQEIAVRYLLPKALKNVGMKSGDVSFDEDALKFIITETDKMYSSATKDKNGKSGMRQLKHIINKIVMKLNMLNSCNVKNNTADDTNVLKLSYEIKNFKLPFIVLKKHVEKLDVLIKKDEPMLSMYA